MGPVAGARRGRRKAAPRSQATGPRIPKGPVLLLSAGATLSVVAWGYLVFIAIEFGSAARGGEDQAWLFLAVASLGAVACLFLALMLAARILRAMGITAPLPDADEDQEAVTSARQPGGRRAAR